MSDFTCISVRDARYHHDRAHGLLLVRPDGALPVMRQIRTWHPGFAEASDERIRSANFTMDDAQLVYARQHGYGSWLALLSHLRAIDADASGEPFLAVCEAASRGEWLRAADLVRAHPELRLARGTNGNSLVNLVTAMLPPANSGAEGDETRLAPLAQLIAMGADLHRANERGWTPLHQAAYRNDVGIAALLLANGARVDGHAHGDGGTPLAVGLFWGHTEVATLLAQHGVAPRNLRITAALGHADDVRVLLEDPAWQAFDQSDSSRPLPEGMRQRAFYRPHSGFPFWTPSPDRQEVLNEALAWAARSGATAVMPLLIDHGAQTDADTYRGTPLAWASWAGRLDTATWLLDHGADVNARGTFGGLQHGAGVTAAHLAAQNDRMEVLSLLVERGANLSITDQLYGATPRGWAEHDGKMTAAEFLFSRGG